MAARNPLLPRGPIVTSALETDAYNLTMQQEARRWDDLVVGYEFIDRSRTPTARLINRAMLQEQLDHMTSLRLTPAEIKELARHHVYTDEHLEWLATAARPQIEVYVDGEHIGMRTEGVFADAIPIESPALAIYNELVMAALARDAGMTRADITRRAHLNFDPKEQFLLANPDIIYSQFGMRRRAFSWIEEDLTARMIDRVPRNMIGIANRYLAMKFDWDPSGTQGHGRDMVAVGYHIGMGTPNPVAHALAENRASWKQLYAGKWDSRIMILLPDAYGTKYTLANMTPQELFDNYTGVRQDSGDPFHFGEMIIDYLAGGGYTPKQIASFTIIFSDGLNIAMMARLRDYFRDRIAVAFGWGTNATCDIGLPTHSFVWKPVYVWVNGVKISLAKLTDNIAKATGDPAMIEQLKQLVGYTETFDQLQAV